MNDTLGILPEGLWLVTLNATAGLMLGAGILSGAAALANLGNPSHLYTTALSSVVCFVAWYHYNKIFSTAFEYVQKGATYKSFHQDPTAQPERTPLVGKQAKSFTIPDIINAYRLSDWLATLPLLGLELEELAKQKGKNMFLPAPYVTALLLFGGISVGAITRFGFSLHTNPRKWLGWVFWFASTGLIGVAYANLLYSDDTTIIVFTAPWALYMALDIVEIGWGSDFFHDVVYAALDVWSKACLAIYVSSKACDVDILTDARNVTG